MELFLLMLYMVYWFIEGAALFCAPILGVCVIGGIVHLVNRHDDPKFARLPLDHPETSSPRARRPLYWPPPQPPEECEFE